MISVTHRVPASTSNLGPGYDCLGVALQISNRVTLTRAAGRRGSMGKMADEAAGRFFAMVEQEPFAFTWSVQGGVPRSRGLGSSVTVRLGLLHGLNQLAQAPLDSERLFRLCADLEGHPDNAAPAAFGGFTLAHPTAPVIRVEVDPALQFVLLIPDFEVSTPAARALLPLELARLAAVKSCNNASRITAAFMSRRYDLLQGCFVDGLHQPFREPLVPFLSKVIAAGEAVGALGGFLSGSGSTICCVTLENEDRVAAAMLAASENPGARTVITSADNLGIQLER